MPGQPLRTQCMMSSQDDFRTQMRPKSSAYDINELVACGERTELCEMKSLSRFDVNEPTRTGYCIAQQSCTDLPILSAEEIQRLFASSPELLAPEAHHPKSHAHDEHGPSTASGSASKDVHTPNDEIRRCFDHGCDGRAFSCRENYLRHLRERRLRIHCDSCNTSFTRKSNLVAHQKSRCKGRQQPQPHPQGPGDASNADEAVDRTER
jgi:hypothetical protein